MKHSFVLAIATEALFGSLVLVCYVLRFSSAIVHLRGKSFSIPFIDAPARLAIGVNSSGLCGALHLADPLDACSSLRNGLRSEEPDKVRFALISRGNCAFEDKIRNAQYGGFHAAIVYDDRDKRNLVSMIGDSDGISVHAVFVSKAAGETLKMLARAEEGECCISPSLEEAAWTVLVISFFSLLVIVSVVAMFFFTRNRRLQLQGANYHPVSIDTKMVEVLPCFTFDSACSHGSRTRETCAICLEDYKDGETLRVLPCQHEFHASCVDSWLTKWGTFCPVCKHDMNADRTAYEANERRPLLVGY